LRRVEEPLCACFVGSRRETAKGHLRGRRSRGGTRAAAAAQRTRPAGVRHMTDTCTYPNDRGEALVAYLYDDIDAAARSAFEAHLSSCTTCRHELDSLQGVRQQLAAWAPPERQGVVDGQPFTVDRI